MSTTRPTTWPSFNSAVCCSSSDGIFEKASIQFGGVDLRIDLGAERVVAAEKDGERIAVEIKSFLGPSVISDFHIALGQFLNYRLALEAQESDRILYLAVPEETYATFFHLPFGQLAVQRYQLKLIVYDAVQEEIMQWIH
jgi:hypothetical protein